MQLADHLRPLLRDHDCVIIPDFGGLVAEYSPARVQPGGRHVISPPSRQVAFNQALTRNDGLLVDALREHLGLPTAEAREAVRQAVATLHHDLSTGQRTELSGIGVLRQVAGRGLQFEYTGTDNLLPAAFGLPELQAHPVRVTDARLAREQQAELLPRLRTAGRGLRLRRLVPSAAIGLLAGLAVATLYLANLHPNLVPVAWRGYVPRWEAVGQVPAPQQATLAQPSLGPAAASMPAPQLTPVVPAGEERTANTTEKVLAPADFAAAETSAAPVAAVSAPARVASSATPLAGKAASAALAPAATTIKARTGRYYVVVGAFATLASAEKSRLVLAKTGRAAKVILPYWGTRLYRLSAADFADAGSASVTAQRLRHNPNFDKGSAVLAY